MAWHVQRAPDKHGKQMQFCILWGLSFSLFCMDLQLTDTINLIQNSHINLTSSGI